jgi:hypothetical protein
MGAFLLHVVRMLGAYLIASLVTGYVVYGSLLITEPGSGVGADAANGGPGFGLMVSFFVAWFALLPAAVTMLLGEVRTWRMWWFYSAAGALIGLGLGSLFQPPAYFPWLGLGLGPVSGGLYWAIAGRHAGAEMSGVRTAVAVLLAAIIVVTALFTLPVLAR